MRFGVVALVVISVTQPVRAEDLVKAKEHYQRGTALYDLQRFTEAAQEYERAYEAKADPALLFNIGQAYRFAGEYGKAIGAFRAFLRYLPSEAPNRPDVEARIAEMQKLLEEQKRSQQQPPGGTMPPGETKSPAVSETPQPVAEKVTEPPPQPPAPRRPAEVSLARPKIIAGLVVGGVGVVAVALGGAFLGLAQSHFDEIHQPAPGYVFNPETQSALDRDRILGATFLGVGGAALAAGATVAVLGFRERRRTSVSATPQLGRSFAGFALTGSF